MSSGNVLCKGEQQKTLLVLVASINFSGMLFFLLFTKSI